MNPYTGTKSHAALDFFQSLLKGSGMPSGFASWMAPTLDPDELERKIVDLRTVLQWLEANVRLTQATLQALEVQRMTLSTLKTMNVDLSDLATHMGEAMRAGAQAMGAASQATAAAAPDRAPEAAPAGGDGAAEAAAPAEAARMPGLVDPMQWWGAISEQFGKVAAEALRDSPWPLNPAAQAATPSAAEPGPADAPPPARKRGAGARQARGSDAAPKGPARKRAAPRPR